MRRTARSREQKRRLEERARARADAAAVRVPGSADVVVVGGGASGLVAAIATARAGTRVAMLEASEEIGMPILATGNGRCNLANTDLSPLHYNAPEFVGHVMGTHPLDTVLGLFGELGLVVEEEEEGRLYPRSRQAASVRNLLVDAARRAGVAMAPLREVTGIGRDGDPVQWSVRFLDKSKVQRTGTPSAPPEQTIRTKAVILATGGGTDHLVTDLHLPVVPTRPANCGLACAPSPLDALDGRRVQALARLVTCDSVHSASASDEAPFGEEDSSPFQTSPLPSAEGVRSPDDGLAGRCSSGEVLFRDGGLTGPPILGLSRFAESGDRILLDLVPELGQGEVVREIVRHLDGRDQPTSLALDGLIDPVVGRTIIDLAGQGWPVPADSVVESAASLAKALPFSVTGRVASHAQVTQGGIALDAIDPETMAVASDDSGASLPAGLFATGEVLDVDGPCGGYNLSFAWLSGLRAGRAAASLAQSDSQDRR